MHVACNPDPFFSLSEGLDDGRLKLPGVDFVLEQDVKLSKCSTLRFRKPEVHPSSADEAEPSPDVARLATPIPCRRVEHKRDDLEGMSVHPMTPWIGLV